MTRLARGADRAVRGRTSGPMTIQTLGNTPKIIGNTPSIPSSHPPPHLL